MSWTKINTVVRTCCDRGKITFYYICRKPHTNSYSRFQVKFLEFSFKTNSLIWIYLKLIEKKDTKKMFQQLIVVKVSNLKKKDEDIFAVAIDSAWLGFSFTSINFARNLIL